MACGDTQLSSAVGEMIVTLDDVACLLDIPVVRRLIAEEDLDYEEGTLLLQSELGLMAAEAISKVNK
jgi:hypothetical protein